MSQLEGIWKMVYATKKTSRQTEYWSDVKLKSLAIPAVLALPMFDDHDTYSEISM